MTTEIPEVLCHYKPPFREKVNWKPTWGCWSTVEEGFIGLTTTQSLVGNGIVNYVRWDLVDIFGGDFYN